MNDKGYQRRVCPRIKEFKWKKNNTKQSFVDTFGILIGAFLDDILIIALDGMRYYNDASINKLFTSILTPHTYDLHAGLAIFFLDVLR